MTLKNAIFTSSCAPRDFRHREIDSTPSRPPESGRIWAALTRKGEPYGESQFNRLNFIVSADERRQSNREIIPRNH